MSAEGSGPSGADRAGERIVAVLFLIGALAGLGAAAVYVAGGRIELEGVLIAVSLGGLGMGVIVWAQRLLPPGLVEEERHPLADRADPAVVRELIDEQRPLTRRKLLLGSLTAAVGGLTAALVLPAFSLGPAPGRSLFTTPWKAGLRLVGLDEAPVNAADIPVGGVLTVFPEGYVGSATAQALLIRVQPELLDLPADRSGWAPEGYICYSKMCTHAGCAVGLYRSSEHQLICPCHQSTFDVLEGARPVFGPAGRPLPQLPIQLQPDGTFVATGDFSGPVGPSFWNIHSGG